MAMNVKYLTCGRTSESDEVYTPFYAVEPLLEFVSNGGGGGITIWCPFDTEHSAFVQTFKEKGFNVVFSHLDDGKDFFEYEPEHWDIMISNPPFSKKDKVLERAYQLGKPFALLLPVNSIQGKARHKIFQNDIQLLVFDTRVDYHTWGNMETYTKGNHFGSAYFLQRNIAVKVGIERIT